MISIFHAEVNKIDGKKSGRMSDIDKHVRTYASAPAQKCGGKCSLVMRPWSKLCLSRSLKPALKLFFIEKMSSQLLLENHEIAQWGIFSLPYLGLFFLSRFFNFSRVLAREGGGGERCDHSGGCNTTDWKWKKKTLHVRCAPFPRERKIVWVDEWKNDARNAHFFQAGEAMWSCIFYVGDQLHSRLYIECMQLKGKFQREIVTLFPP